MKSLLTPLVNAALGFLILAVALHVAWALLAPLLLPLSLILLVATALYVVLWRRR